MNYQLAAVKQERVFHFFQLLMREYRSSAKKGLLPIG